MSVKDRIKEYLTSQNITISQFEKSIKASNGYINNISKSIGLEKLTLIVEKYPNLSLDWLITAKGMMLRDGNVQSSTVIKNEDFKELADSRKELLEYKDKEILELKRNLENLEKELQFLKSKNDIK